MFAHLVFGMPWLLGFLAGLPVLWWLLRLTPPSPKKTPFPALALLRDLAVTEQTPARTPWWLLFLRVTIASLVIAAFAGPLIDPQPSLPGPGAVLLAVDNDWAAARAWDGRRELLHHLIAQAEREDREVILLPTAPPATGGALQLLGPMAAKAAYAIADHLAPMPWTADWTEASRLLGTLEKDHIAYAAWLNSGLGDKSAAAFFETLKSFGTLKNAQLFSDPETPLYVLAPPKNNGDDTSFSVMRAQTSGAAKVSVVAMGGDGHVLAHIQADFADGGPRAVAKLDLPLDVHNEVVRLELEGQRTAATVALLDEDWQRRPVGIAGDKAEEAEHSLLSGLFYIDRALKPFADIHVEPLDKLLGENMAVLVLTDATSLGDGDIVSLSGWVKKGGVLVRFAGDRLAAAQNPHEMELLPVTLRTGDRAMGGTMSWATPQKLREFAAGSPFQGLTIPADVTINRQILAEPSVDLAQRSWATLGDGTPLVTAKALGRGLSILFHIPARSEWSNLPLSGLFVDMLRRIVELSRTGSGGDLRFTSLAPLQMLDAFGNEQPPGPAVQPTEGDDLSIIRIGPQHPPGIYGGEGFTRALNLGAAIGQPSALTGMQTESYRLDNAQIDLQPWLLMAAFILLLLDLLISLRLRGLLARNLAAKAALVFLLSSFAVQPASAADDKTPVEFTSKTYLAYVETGNRQIDTVSEAGLNGLARVLQRRTSLDQIGVAGVNPESDELVFFPLLYWPLDPAAAPLSGNAVRRVNDYLHHGGMILFDSGFQGDALSPAVMKHLLAGVDIPPLVRIPENHVLRRSFYLLDEFPGRNAGGDLWLEPEDVATFDGVAAVIAGSGAWAGAWAIGDNGRPLYPCTPDGEAQREMAFRFGVNVVMYALTGNYKSDQLHAQALLERLGK